MPPGAGSGRPLDVVILRPDDLDASTYPAHAEFVYGEWLRRTFGPGEAPDFGADPELTLMLARLAADGRPDYLGAMKFARLDAAFPLI